MSWRAAFGYCAQTGGHLAVINNAAEFNLTLSIHMLHQAPSYSTRNTWVDGTDFVVEGRWICPSINAACPYIRWDILTGQPNNALQNQHCLGFYQAHTAGLHDFECGGATHVGMPLCEYECSH